MARLNRIWRCSIISSSSKFKLYKFLVTPNLVYGCETWTLLADSEKGSKLSKPSAWGNFSASPTWSTRQRLGAGQDQLPCGSTGTSSGNRQEMETCMVRAYHTPRQPLQNHLLGHLGGWATPWSAKEMLDGQSKSGHPCPCQSCSKGPPTEKTGRGSLLIVHHVPPTTKRVKGLN